MIRNGIYSGAVVRLLRPISGQERGSRSRQHSQYRSSALENKSGFILNSGELALVSAACRKQPGGSRRPTTATLGGLSPGPSMESEKLLCQLSITNTPGTRDQCEDSIDNTSAKHSSED